jgi:hypothetical protein
MATGLGSGGDPVSTDAGSGFDKLAAGRDAGDERFEEESSHLPAEDADEEVLEDARERKQAQDDVNDAF